MLWRLEGEAGIFEKDAAEQEVAPTGDQMQQGSVAKQQGQTAAAHAAEEEIPTMNAITTNTDYFCAGDRHAMLWRLEEAAEQMAPTGDQMQQGSVAKQQGQTAAAHAAEEEIQAMNAITNTDAIAMEMR
ncbi:hypothetical protein niasHT_005134 [Heterodera trifolii]|uniref:Uncharacterized protein n=1 Tax=Heterodera trifolii TaxID=157864 RepID=A0ABD2M7Y9_9BILA